MQEPTHATIELGEIQRELLTEYYQDDLGELARKWPNEQQSLAIGWSDLHKWNVEVADELLQADPEGVQRTLAEAVESYDLPVDVDLSGVQVRVGDLPEGHTFWPREFSPADRDQEYLAVRGEVGKSTDVQPRLKEGAFRCVRCETLTRTSQRPGELQEPHQCRSCERQGPFDIERDQSTFVDSQAVALRTPPEHASTAGDELVVHLEGELTDVMSVGDRVTVSGIVNLEQVNDANKFDPELDAHRIEIDRSDTTELDVSQEDREKIREFANGEHGDPLTLAGQSLTTKIHGYGEVKKALVLAAVGGAHTEYEAGDDDRGKFHVLLIGDPSTGKSVLVNRVADVMLRSVSASSTQSTSAGLLSTAVQDDFGGGDWTLKPGAFAKANGGVVAIDELDDMEPSVRASILEPMSNQEINVNKGGINATLQTRAAVVAASNPESGRFDEYEPVSQQFAFNPTLMSRFDLIYTFKDRPDPDSDRELGEHILETNDAAKRKDRDDLEGPTDGAEPPVEPELLRDWIALSGRQPKPVFAEGVKDHLLESWTTLRSLYNYDEDQPVPVTVRKLEGTRRVAEAAAKLEFSGTVEMRHAEIATQLVGRSMQDIGQDEDGQFDADVVETGTSKTQRDRIKNLKALIGDLSSEYEESKVPVEDLLDKAEEIGIGRDKADREVEKLLQKGELAAPDNGVVRFVGRA